MSALITPIIEDEIDNTVAQRANFLDPRTEDAALMAAAKRGDGRAFEVLVGRHESRIRAIASRIVGVAEDAEDIAQQSFQKAFIHLQQFEGNSTFSTWLTRITVNEALTWLRKRRAAREVSIEESSTKNGAMPTLDSPDPRPNPEGGYLQRERKQILSRAMNRLTPGMRTAVQLRHINELSTDETAGIMKVSVSAVKARIFHGRRKLRAMLKRYVESGRTQGSMAMLTGNEAKGAPEPSACCAGN